MASQVMRITLKAYDHQLVDASAKKIIETALWSLCTCEQLLRLLQLPS